MAFVVVIPIILGKEGAVHIDNPDYIVRPMVSFVSAGTSVVITNSLNSSNYFYFKK